MLDLNRISKHAEVAYDDKYKPADFNRRPLTDDQKAIRDIKRLLMLAALIIVWVGVTVATLNGGNL